jgi:SAM-dependent methyltransferase
VTGDRFEIVRCQKCGLAMTQPQPSPASLERYYPTGYFGTPKKSRFPSLLEWLQQQLYGRRVNGVERLRNGRAGRVLDIGCGRGELLREFRRRGWDPQGTEWTEASAAHARNALEIPVEVGPLTTLPWPNATFDSVVMWHVLEHLADPQSAIAEAVRVLKPGGVLLIGVPNFASAEARLARGQWFHLDAPRHLTHLTPQFLRGALREVGLKPRRTSFFALEYDYFSFTQSALNRLGFRQNLLYNLLRRPGAKVLAGDGAGWWQVLLTLLLAVPLGVLSVPVTFLAGVVRQGATVTMYAVETRRDHGDSQP